MRIILAVMMMAMAGGCMGKRPANLATTRPVTDVDPQLAENDYWLAKPASVEVRGDFEKLWQASEDAAHEFLFKIDRRDKRSGLMTTEPLISKQFWEFWRKDVGTLRDANEATLASAPKVIVEKDSKVDPIYKADIEGPSTYWYAMRRDEVVEKRVAAAVRKKLNP